MKTRMEKYHSVDNIPQRTEKNNYLYDEIYSQKKEPTSNVAVLDNVNEIDINKIKSLINNREEYRKVRTYSNIIGREESEKKEIAEVTFDESESKNYDINEVLRMKRSNRENFIEPERIRKISNTQYDILKGLNLKEPIDDDEMDHEFFTQGKELKSLINTITNKTEENTSTDFFKDLKGGPNEAPIPTKVVEESKEKTEGNTFYGSSLSFGKDDFDDLENLKKEVKKHTTTTKILLIIVIFIVVLAITFLAINYIDFKSLLN